MSSQKYHPTMVALHWLMFVLIVAALASIEIRGWIPHESGASLRDRLINWHIDAGVLILLFVLLRVLTRARVGVPAASASGATALAARALHACLYLVMLLQPLSGMVMTQLAGYDVELFGLALLTVFSENSGWHDQVGEVHHFLGNALYFLIGGHVLAALWHHLILKQQTLKRMSFK